MPRSAQGRVLPCAPHHPARHSKTRPWAPAAHRRPVQRERQHPIRIVGGSNSAEMNPVISARKGPALAHSVMPWKGAEAGGHECLCHMGSNIRRETLVGVEDMIRRCVLALALIATLAGLVSCASMPPAPADGKVSFEIADARVRGVLPVSARGVRRSGPANWSIYRQDLGEDHTVSASILIGEKVPADKTDTEMLEWWMEGFERELPKGPGRQGAVLRSIERIGGTRLQNLDESVPCVEYVWVNEDRLVPGHSGEAFVMHAHEYVCIHPRAHVVVRAHFSERYAVDRGQLRSDFQDDVDFWFDSIQLP